MSHRPIPPRWLHCPRKSQLIANKFVAFKTPLDATYNDQIAEEFRFDWAMLALSMQSMKVDVGLVIDLTNTTRFYNKNDVEALNITHVKLQCRGHGVTPSKEQTEIFIRICKMFWDKNPDRKIGVHCTHGFNRSGFLISSFLVEEEDWSIEDAVQLFAKCRPTGIYKQDYLQELCQRYGDPQNVMQAPELPEWCLEEDEASDNETDSGYSSTDRRRKRRRMNAMIAQSKSSGSKCDFTDDTALTRLFVICPKEFSEEDLRAKFESFGEIEYVQIVKDHATKENKGFGYVKFYKASTAAFALENCDKGLKAVMAEPKSSKFQRKSSGPVPMNNSSTGGGSNNNLSTPLSSQQQASAPGMPVNPFIDPYVFQQAIAEYAAHGFSPSAAAAAAMGIQNMQMMQGSPAMQSPQGMDTFPGGTPPVSTRLFVIVSPAVSQDQLSKLFDLIPGMELCDLKRRHGSGDSKGFAYVTFNSIGSAVYAKEKLNGFEYPPGHKLVVKYAEDPPNNRPGGTGAAVSNPSHQPSFQIDGSPVYTSAALPAPQALADSNTEPAARLFIVCHPSPPPEHTLKDVFSRFGNLIDVWIMRDRNFGYAKFASKESADAAIQGLHGQEVLGMRLNVLHADPPKSRAPHKPTK